MSRQDGEYGRRSKISCALGLGIYGDSNSESEEEPKEEQEDEDDDSDEELKVRGSKKRIRSWGLVRKNRHKFEAAKS